MGKQKTTRDVEFNYDKDVASKTISSIVSYKATKDYQNIRLLDFEEGVNVSGQAIKTHAANNQTMADLGYKDAKIDTSNINAVDKYRVYGAPFQVVLNNRQNYNNCGIESTLNTLATAGIVKMNENLSDQKKVEKDFLQVLWNLGLAGDDGVIGTLDKPDGGTFPDNYRDIFAYFDIASEAYYYTKKCDGTEYQDINELAYKISQGYGAIVGVCSDILWQSKKSETGEKKIDHAVSIIGVVYDENTLPDGNNAPKGFYIQDTGAWMTRYISLEEFEEATLYNYHGMLAADKDEYWNYDAGEYYYDPDKYLSGLRSFDGEGRQYVGKQPGGIAVTITSEPIKTDMFNIDATGDSRDNIIWGNNGENVIKGNGGNDILYGNADDDEIRGGSGNDVIIGNNLSEEIRDYIKDSFDITLDDIDTSEVYQVGDNILYGDSGNDVIIGGDQTDLIYGGDGKDFIWTGNGRNAAYGGSGNDIIIGGSKTDRLFGDGGNDVIYGLGDDDIISGGAGNDQIFGGRGNDIIETGSGNDIVYIEGKEHGIDNISSQGGKTYLSFIDEMNGEEIKSDAAEVSDMVFSLDLNSKTNKYDFGISYLNQEDVVDGVIFKEICNKKAGSSKFLNIIEADGTTYKVSESNSKTVKASAGNNIMFSLYEKGATIKTGAGNDIVTMVETDATSQAYKTRVDKITYTGGSDRYVSEEGDTYYTVKGFGEDTVLAIQDNVEALKKIEDKDGQSVEIEVVSNDDRLYLDCAKNNLQFFFDVGINDDTDAITTGRDGLIIFDKSSLTSDKIVSLVQDTEEVQGLVYMDDFFAADREFNEADFYGNGRIEHIYYQGETPYEDLAINITGIAAQVAGWLSDEGYNTGDYTTAFEAFNDFDNLTAAAQTALVNCYNSVV